MDTRDRMRGCLLGLGAGDALGAPYEGGPLERAVWWLIGRSASGARFTDDTQMTLDIASSFLEHGRLDQDALALRFAASYRWSRGYGPGAARLLKQIRRGVPWQEAARSVYPSGSFGNGAAMRAPVLALLFADDDERDDAARRSAVITHAHPIGVDGAVVIAAATRRFFEGASRGTILSDVCQRAQTTLRERLLTIDDAEHSPRAVAKALGNGITVEASCPTAIYVALRFREAPFEDMLGFVRQVGGDVDTIAAMAGAMWGAGRGEAAIPAIPFEGRDRLREVADQIHALASGG